MTSRGELLARRLMEAEDYPDDELQSEINNLQVALNEIKNGYKNTGRDDMLASIKKLLELLSNEKEQLVIRRQL